MAYPKREEPLTDEEKKARNRQYQHTRRHKTNNGYSRAYRRAGQRAIQWFKDNEPNQWAKWVAEELDIVEDNPYAPLRSNKPGTKGEVVCMHDGTKTIIGFTVGCNLCGKSVGSVSIEDTDRKNLNRQYKIT